MPFLVVADGMVHDNPYHIEPAGFSLRYWLGDAAQPLAVTALLVSNFPRSGACSSSPCS